MNLSKIGKFISTCRKNKKLTQEQLANKLAITDRAVSKWERGISLPDASIMLELCNILDISVNELLIGDKIDMKEQKDKTEELLIEMAKQEELKNKKLFFNTIILEISVVIFYLALVLITYFILHEGKTYNIIIGLSTFLFIVICVFMVKIEVGIGYCECKKCHYRYIPSFGKAMMAIHSGTTRYMKCPKCGKRSWNKKVMFK